MPVSIATPTGNPNFDVTAVLDGETYTLYFKWNVRWSTWFLEVHDEDDENVLIAGVALRADYGLAAYFTGRAPPGMFVAVDTSGQGLDPGLNDLGARVQVQYFSAGELGQ